MEIVRDRTIPAECDPRIRAMHTYWDGKRGRAPLPGRPDIDPLELRPYLPRLMLLDVESERAYRYRLVGTEIVDELGFEPTGRTVCGCYPPGQVEELLANFALVARKAAPLFDDRPWPCRRWAPWRDETLYLPLGADAAVDKIMVYSVRAR